ncbi:PhoX family protein [Nodosilinea nodulosa]|uniref:PhoX family protein n=1 Tax=Nodosilinea nodulosa TaxID=416001 RepID=UPI0002D9507B|nr:alkaline phosphatase PhoX [Nodosilinea nodulosa]
MSLNRRQFLLFFGAAAGTAALGSFPTASSGGLGQPALASTGLAFKPVNLPLPLKTMGLSADQQMAEFSSFTVVDDLVLPEGYVYDVVAAWGDSVGDGHFGYNNDYLSYVETAPGQGFLSVNFEYISAATWMETYGPVLGKSLPFEAVKAAVAAAGDDGVDAFSLPEGDPLKGQIRAIAEAALSDLGIGVISVRQAAGGGWERTNSGSDRRITGIAGLKDDRYLKTTGPAAAVFRKTSGSGYLDGLGDRIVGTFANCAGGTTPWGTMLSAEENFQDYVPEGVHADGTALSPSEKTFAIDPDGLNGLGNVLGLAGNKYGWMVEVDPANPNDYGTKHTWMGRYRHEAVGIRATANQKLALYSGCDRRGGHLYKFVSTDTVVDPKAKSNSRLLADGRLYAAKFNADGTGRWIALKADTPVNPYLPSQIEGGLITLPKRPAGGFTKVEDDADIAAFKTQFKTLGDLYSGSDLERQGAILIDAHFAANAAGATPTARPEDTMVHADGTLFINFTSGSPGGDGGPDKAIFKGPNGESPYEYGWIMKLKEDSNDPAAMTFRWEVLHVGGEPAEGGMGFANPDNMELDARGNLWMVTDMSSDKHNKALPSRVDSEGKPVSQSNLRGLFGNNSIWYLPLQGENAGQAFVFGYAPMESEMTGPFMTTDMKSLFISAQHPGEINGLRKDMAVETRAFAMTTTDGKPFMQQRQVPIGSNWPAGAANAAPRPAVVVIRRANGDDLA